MTLRQGGSKLEDIALVLSSLPNLKHLEIDDISPELILAAALYCQELITLKTPFLDIPNLQGFDQLVSALATLACACPSLKSFKFADFDCGHHEELHDDDMMASQLANWTPSRARCGWALEIARFGLATGQDTLLSLSTPALTTPKVSIGRLKALFDRKCSIAASGREQQQHAKHRCYACLWAAKKEKQRANERCCKVSGNVPVYVYKPLRCRDCKSGRWEIEAVEDEDVGPPTYMYYN